MEALVLSRVRVVSSSHRWLKILVPPSAILVTYFVVPVNADDAPLGVALGILLSVASLGAVVMLVAREARRDERRLTGLDFVISLEVALFVFAFMYYLIVVNEPGQFDGMVTRLDAIYFSMTTASTVGYGDIHAVGQFARTMVIIQMVFNLVFIGALVNLARDQMHERRTIRRQTAAPTELPAEHGDDARDL
jgi:hypothetical protein